MIPSLIICTYNAPRELEFALCGVARQSVMPHEVLIADDGSGDETRAIVERWRERLNCSVKHVWQSDRGYRKARIVNEAVRKSSGDYLLFLDGDSFPHPRWVEDHMATARPDTVQCGRRVKLGPELSPTVRIEDIEDGRFDGLSGRLIRSALKKDTLRLGLGVRLPLTIARTIHSRPRRLMGVNYSLPKEVFLAVNGYDEAWTVYGHEDLDIEQRLKRADYRFQSILNRGIVYHVYHAEREQSEEGMRLVDKAINGAHIRCDSGIEGGAPFDPSC